jgi:hypothetical protein
MAAPVDDDVLEKMRAAYAELRARVAYLEKHLEIFASDEDLAHPQGDPQVKFPPKSWRGENYTGKRYSECSPDFLEVLAGTLDWMADNPQAGKEKFAKYNRLDAKRARSWARRLRVGWTPPPPPEPRAARAPRERPARAPRASRRGADAGPPPAEPAPAPAAPLPNYGADADGVLPDDTPEMAFPDDDDLGTSAELEDDDPFNHEDLDE